MRFVINTRFLIPGKMEGYGYFIEEIFTRIAKNHPEHEFYFLFDRPVPPHYTFSPNVQAVVAGPQARHPLLWYYWYNRTVPSVLKKLKADVFVSPDGFCSLRTKIPQCLVVHDLAFLHYPSFIHKSHLLFYRKYTPEFLKKAKQVVSVSEFSKNDLIQNYKIQPEKIKIVFNATHPLFQPVSDEVREKVKEDFAEGTEYFIYTGTIHPRKNLVNLLKAFSIFKKKQKSNMKLVIAGRMAWKNNVFKELLNTYKYRKEVVLTGYLSKEQLALLVASAYALVYPSFYEGFGVPPLEALQCGVPAIVSRVSALPEIGGDAYLYIDPESIEDIAGKMMLIYKDETLRKKLIENGKERISLFSWEQSAVQMWKALEQTAGIE